MYWKISTLAITLLLMICGSVTGVQTNQPSSPSVFRENSPPELLKELNEKVIAFKSKYPLSSEAEDNVRKAVAGLSLTCSSSLSEDNEMKIREAGPGAVSVIGNLLASQDRQLRLRALDASGLFLKFRHEKTEEYINIETLLILLYRRSLFDTDAEVRYGAVWGLFGIASRRIPKSPLSVEAALRNTMKEDPDEKVRKAADLALQDLGIIPRDPSRTEIVN